MIPPTEIRSALAPLQRRMLEDSLADPQAGHHVEQLEIVFAAGLTQERILSAWQATVAATETLRITFSLDRLDIWRSSLPPTTRIEDASPPSWDRWLDEDRQNSLLEDGRVPWRTVFWPKNRRFVWTFHHALLDGRSITRIVHAVLSRLAGGDPGTLAISRWQPPSPAVVSQAGAIFRRSPGNPVARPLAATFDFQKPACRPLGKNLADDLHRVCSSMEITPATALMWCWAQALARAQGRSWIWLEQIRCGAPQPATAGFTMNTLPVAVARLSSGSVTAALRDFREQLLELRPIESVCPADFADGIHPDLDGPETSVVMIEHATLNHHLASFSRLIKSLELHEADGCSLAASAHIAPDLHLRVDGPENDHLLDAWCASVLQLIDGRV